MSCASGFYDPIYGGIRWKRPDDTNQRGGWIRSATAVRATSITATIAVAVARSTASAANASG
jgi:hypothetical protein